MFSLSLFVIWLATIDTWTFQFLRTINLHTLSPPSCNKLFGIFSPDFARLSKPYFKYLILYSINII